MYLYGAKQLVPPHSFASHDHEDIMQLPIPMVGSCMMSSCSATNTEEVHFDHLQVFAGTLKPLCQSKSNAVNNSMLASLPAHHFTTDSL